MEVTVYQHDSGTANCFPRQSATWFRRCRWARRCVRNRFLGDWTTGFKVAEVLSDGYRIRRLSDGHSFPDVFAFDDVRLERRQHPLREISGSHLDRRH